MSYVYEIVYKCLACDNEEEWFDFKENWFESDEVGQYFS